MSVANQVSRRDEGIDLLIVEVIHDGCGLWRGRVGGEEWQIGSLLVARWRESYPTAGQSKLQLPSQILARLTSKAKLAPHFEIQVLLSEWSGGTCQVLDPWRACLAAWPAGQVKSLVLGLGSE